MGNSDINPLPSPAHIQADSMLARRFGKETVNYFGGTFALILGQDRDKRR
jgi:NAD+ diphosphatase